MKVSAKTEYACIALLELANGFSTGEPIRIRQIADEHEIPQRFLVQILLQLKGAGLVASTRGASGGYQLTRKPEEITLGEIIATIEGPPESSYSTAFKNVTPASAALSSVWRDVDQIQQKMLTNITLAELCERAKPTCQDMYYI